MKKTNWRSWLSKWNMNNLKIKTPFLEIEWNPKDADKKAAWDLYVELLTRITTQPLDESEGDEVTALESIYSLFKSTRTVLKENGKECLEFAKIAIVVLNQVIRPFTSKWHKLKIEGRIDTLEGKRKFRSELSELQPVIIKYTKMLADMAGVEDLTELEDLL